MRNLLIIAALMVAIALVGGLSYLDVVDENVFAGAIAVGSLVIPAISILSVIDYARKPETRSRGGVLPVLARCFTGVFGVLLVGLGALIIGWILYMIPQSSFEKAKYGVFLATAVWVPAVLWGIKLIRVSMRKES